MENVQKSALPPQQGSPAVAPHSALVPGWAGCCRAGLGHLPGLWPELSAFSREPGLLLRAACAPRLCGAKGEGDASETQPTALGSSWPCTGSCEHHSIILQLWLGSPSAALVLLGVVCLSVCLHAANSVQLPSMSIPRGSVHTQDQSWGFQPAVQPTSVGTHLCKSRQLCEGESVIWETIPWHWGGTRAKECSSQLCSELQLLWLQGGWMLHPHGVTTLLSSTDARRLTQNRGWTKLKNKAGIY